MMSSCSIINISYEDADGDKHDIDPCSKFARNEGMVTLEIERFYFYPAVRLEKKE